MSIEFLSVTVRHERRVRLLFSNALASGAFLTSLYAVTCTNAVSASPSISAALPVPNTPNGVDLVLGDDLGAGGEYVAASAAVPAVDSSTSSASSAGFLFGDLASTTENIELPQDDVGALVYGIDLRHSGADFLEGSNGDLDSVSGIPNVQGAQQRRLSDESGLPWDQDYGAKAENFVNGPTPNGLALQGALLRQAISDDRVLSASTSFVEDDANPGDVYFPVKIQLRGAPQGDPFVVNVNLPTSE